MRRIPVASVLVAYYSRTGNTRKMAVAIAKGVESQGVEAIVREVQKLRMDRLPDWDAIILGSPTYYGTMASEVKKLLDESVKLHGRLEGRVGGAFSSSANIAGGNETTILDIVNALLIHGMIVQGDPRGDHYGPVSIGAPDKRSLDQCTRYGERVALLVKRLNSRAGTSGFGRGKGKRGRGRMGKQGWIAEG
jgi:NAD(P)H dehydrogenase (quinone)